ncbi:anti-sigma factor [Bacillus sp. S3]|uniref:anti-sigma factor n=1 Tax=Bacillus sp. S3 TaxID=486398 RepID=UPI0011885A45|nr:anti-sigma factor [Bacillus sp. S3]QCJ40962.1 anti-sigma factor [Bacillus sp. S3]
MEDKCENLSLYIIGELSVHEMAQFEHHLKTCKHCRKEVNSLKETWQMLSYDVEEMDVPESLKAEVMDFIFQENGTASLVQVKAANHQSTSPVVEVERKEHHFLDRLKGVLERHFSALSAGITAVLLAGVIGLYWSNLQLKENITALENKTGSQMQIVRTFDLKGMNSAAAASGNAYLLQESSDSVLVIELSKLPSTKDEEVYQVWLLKNGHRQSAGTLKPDLNGKGIITSRLPKDLSFDDIGITLEPNPNNTQPQGQKVIGTS